MATGRSQRIDEMISQKIKSGEKFSLKDLGTIMQDVTDIQARENVPIIEQTVRTALPELNDEQNHIVETMLSHFKGWKGTFEEESTAATVYSFW